MRRWEEQRDPGLVLRAWEEESGVHRGDDAEGVEQRLEDGVGGAAERRGDEALDEVRVERGGALRSDERGGGAEAEPEAASASRSGAAHGETSLGLVGSAEARQSRSRPDRPTFGVRRPAAGGLT